MEKKNLSKSINLVLIAFFILLLSGCEKAFFNDGDPEVGINSSEQYLYLVENGTKNLLMLDNNLNTLQRWDLSGLVGTDIISGVACSNEYLWISVAGSTKQIFKLANDVGTVLVLETMVAPPDAKGTIRDLAWDGANLWALNSGSTSLGIPGQLFKINVNDNSVVGAYDINVSNARGITYVGENSDVYGRSIPKGIYVTDVQLNKVYILDERNTFYEFFETPLHPRGIHYTFPNAISWSDDLFFLINSSASSGNFLHILRHKGGAYNVEIVNMLELPFESPTALFWSDFDFRKGINPELLSVVPNTAKKGENLTVSINGKGLKPSLSVSFGDGITVSATNFQNSNLITADISVSETAAIGSRNVVLTDTEGNTFTGENFFSVVELNPNDGFIYYCDNFDGSLNKIRIADGVLVEKWYPSFVDPASLQGLEFHAGSLWISSAGSTDKVFKVDPSDMTTILSSFDAPPDKEGTIREMDFDSEGNMWILNSTTSTIYKIDVSDGSIIGQISTPNETRGERGMVIVDDDLYCNDKDTKNVYKYDFSSATWSAVFAMPAPPGGTVANRFPTGMTWDGVNFWIANSTGIYDYLMQISPTGNLIQSIPVPNIGPSLITGIAFTY